MASRVAASLVSLLLPGAPAVARTPGLSLRLTSSAPLVSPFDHFHMPIPDLFSSSAITHFYRCSCPVPFLSPTTSISLYLIILIWTLSSAPPLHTREYSKHGQKRLKDLLIITLGFAYKWSARDPQTTLNSKP